MRWLFAPGARWRVFWIAIGLLGVLDVARSLNARNGYARPSEIWHPEPSRYADLTWPPGASLAKETPLGDRVFAQHCAVCHGPDGRGNGPAAPSMIPRPRDFTAGEFHYKSTAAGEPPTDDELRGTVANGLHASAMPYFRDVLTAQEIDAVAKHVKQLSDAFQGPAPQPLTVPARVTPDAASVTRGHQLYAMACVSCHGVDGREWKTFQDARGDPIRARDLTAPWTFRGGAEPEALWLRLTTGLGAMPSYGESLTAEQRWDVVNYVLTLARKAPWEAGGKLEGPGHAADKLARGDYLVHSEMCGLCHTMIDRSGIYRGDDMYLAGGMRVGAYPHGFNVSRNLTGDAETGLGVRSEDSVVAAMTNGQTTDRMLNSIAMPWPILHRLTDEDAHAVAAYLKSQPPVHNAIPPPLRYGFVETVAMKLTRPLPAAISERLTYADGNFGNLGLEPSLRQSALVRAQWAVLATCLLLLVIAGPRGGRRPRRRKLRAFLFVLGLALLALLTGVLYDLPNLSRIPPDQLSAGFLAGLPEINPKAFHGPEDLALGQRGRYLFTVNSCAMCHRPDGSGGLKISWRPMGSIWTRNITPDVTTGVGAWSDQELARAIRSGISKDGRVLHWQGMIWDHDSNLDEEDVRALIRWLRALPPIKHAVSKPFPPSDADCETYTFFPLVDRAPKSGCVTTE
jgi:mono/diheme cytochrome c family protein